MHKRPLRTKVARQVFDLPSVRAQTHRKKRRWEPTPERLLSLSALFISLLSLIFSLWQASRTITHNKLTLLPHVDFSRHGIASAPSLGIALLNNGVGPAVVKHMEIFLDGKRVNDWESVISANPAMWRGVTPSFWLLGADVYVRATEEVFLFRTGPQNVSDIDAFRELINKRLGVRVTYCSVYEECMEACTASIPCPK